jgi:hypothetical protein
MLMAKAIKSDAVWVEIDPETLEAQQAQAYAAYKASYRVMKEQRGAFEAAMAQGVPQGKRMIFGYNFGKLSVAVVDDDRATAKPKAQKMSLAEYLERQAVL